MSDSNRFKRIRDQYVRFAEGKGFALTITLCIAVITASAVWTGREAQSLPTPTPPVGRELSASALDQDSLADVITARPTATPAPLAFSPPLAVMTVLTPYSDAAFTRAAATGIWQLHAAVDLSAQAGSEVFSPADGRVTSVSGDDRTGFLVSIGHGDGIETCCSGLSMVAALREGDKVRAGQIIGYAAGTAACGHQEAACIHFSASQNGKPIDPMTLLPQP